MVPIVPNVLNSLNVFNHTWIDTAPSVGRGSKGVKAADQFGIAAGKRFPMFREPQDEPKKL